MTGDDAHHDYLIQGVSGCADLVMVIRERRHDQRMGLFKRGKYLRFAFAQYHAARRNLCGLDRYRQEFFNGLCTNVYTCNTSFTDNINANDTVAAINKNNPDIIIVMGTSVLKDQVLGCTNSVFINIHGGFLPDYRGNHCFFFAMYHKEYSKVGSTIHFVEKGIDTGPIIRKAQINPKITDHPEKLYCVAEKMAVDQLVRLLSEYQSAEKFPKTPQPFRGKLYNTRDRLPWHDLILFLRRTIARVASPHTVEKWQHIFSVDFN